MSITVEACERLLPQTHCRQCSYDGCHPYAVALVEGKEPLINRCRPGGQAVVDALAELFQVPTVEPLQEALAECNIVVQVDQCIGCTLCIQACPVDAIVGAPKMQHQVIEDHCTGCQLCLPVCPTACMEIVPRSLPLPSKEANRARVEAKHAREQEQELFRMKQHRSLVAQVPDVLALCLKKNHDS
jgi:electron transport complex protein RnfB